MAPNGPEGTQDTTPQLVETLTESFCERCGTRYEFKAPTRLNPLRKTRGFIGGLRNYLTSQDALSDAVGDAMRSEEDSLASAQLDAFHESFNFCIDCRQYTCVNCWNDDAGRCRGCAPIPGTDDLAERMAASFAPADVGPPILTDADVQRRLGFDGWPSSDLVVTGGTGGNGHPVEWPEAELAYPPAAEVEPELVPEPIVAEVEPEFVPEPMVAEVEPEPEPVAAAVEPEPEPMVAEVEPEPVVAETAQEPSVYEHVAATEAWREQTTAEIWPELTEPELPEPEGIGGGIEIEPVRAPLRVVAWDEDAAEEPAVAEIEPEPEPVAAQAEPEPAFTEVPPAPVMAVELEPIVAEVAPEPEPVAAEVAPEPEPEPVAAEVAPEPEPEPVAAEVESEPEPVAAEVAPEPEPEPVAAEVEPEPEPEMERRRIAPIHETILHFPSRVAPPPADEEPAAAAAAQADTPELAARRAQLDLLGLGDQDAGAVGPETPQALPYRSRGAAVTQAELARMASMRGSFWEASARQVASATAHVGVQSCGQCGLSLSANARFCRRCGTRQAQSA